MVGESLGLLGKRSRGGKVSILTILVIAVILIGAYFYFTMGTGGIRQAIQGTLPPDIEITSTNTRSGAKGLDYVGYVDISVYNSGGKGTITVWVEVTQGSNSWKKTQSVYLDHQGSANLTFEFREVGILRSWTARVGVTY